MKGKKLVLLFILGLFILISLLAIAFFIEFAFVLMACNGFFSAGIGNFVLKQECRFSMLGWKDVFFLSAYIILKILAFTAFTMMVTLSIRKMTWLSAYFCSLYTKMLQLSAMMVFFIVPFWVFFLAKYWAILAIIIAVLTVFTLIVSFMFRNLLVPIHEGENHN